MGGAGAEHPLAGSFLPEEARHPSWAVSFRERLRGKFLRAVGLLGGHWERAGVWGKAAACYRKGLDTDDLAEEFYRGLMICHVRLGREGDAVSLYKSCREALSSHLGVGPSRETETLYRSLAAGGD